MMTRSALEVRDEVVGSEADRSVRGWAIAAGAGLVLMAVLAGFGNFVAVDGLVTAGDADRTARDVLASEGLFRAGIACFFVVVLLDVLVAVALYRIFSPVSRTVSLLTATFRFVYAGVFLVSLGQLVTGLRLLDAQSPGDALGEFTAFSDLWMLGLGLFAVHLLLLGYLAYRSGFVPKVLAVLLAIAGLGYLTDTAGAVFARELTWSSYTFAGEVLLALWLLIRPGAAVSGRVRRAPARATH